MEVSYKASEIAPKHHEPQNAKNVLKVFDNMPQPHELPRYRWNIKIGYKASKIAPKHHEPQNAKNVLKIFDNMPQPHELPRYR